MKSQLVSFTIQIFRFSMYILSLGVNEKDLLVRQRHLLNERLRLNMAGGIGVKSEDLIAYSESVLYLVLPSLTLFIIFPQLMKRGWDFWPSLGLGIIATIVLYGIGVAIATKLVTGGQA